MTDSEEISEGTADEYEEEEQGIIDRIINVFLDPAALFKGLAKRPEFWTPVILIIVVNALLTIVTYPATKDMRLEVKRMQWQFSVRESDEKKKQEKIIEKEKEYVERGQKIEPYTKAFMKIFIVIVFLAAAGALYLISLIQGLDTSFKRIFSVVTYAGIIGLLGNIIDQLLKLLNVVKPETLIEWQIPVTGLAFHISSKMHMAVYLLLTLLDPFVIWGFIVVAIGLRYANNCKLWSAILTVIIYVILFALILVGSGFITQMGLDKMAESGGGHVVIQAG